MVLFDSKYNHYSSQKSPFINSELNFINCKIKSLFYVYFMFFESNYNFVFLEMPIVLTVFLESLVGVPMDWFFENLGVDFVCLLGV